MNEQELERKLPIFTLPEWCLPLVSVFGNKHAVRLLRFLWGLFCRMIHNRQCATSNSFGFFHLNCVSPLLDRIFFLICHNIIFKVKRLNVTNLGGPKNHRTLVRLCSTRYIKNLGFSGNCKFITRINIRVFSQDIAP